MKTYKSITLGLLGITTMLASCSQDEMLQSPTSGKNLVTVTATLPNGIQTRSDATQDEKSAIKRCVLAVYKTDGTFVKKMEDTTPADGFTFQFDADDTESKYNYYCWADDGESYTIDENLTNITVSSELPAIAQRGEALEKALSDGDVTVPMSHAVAKISLKGTADFSNASVKVEAYTHKAYNATTGKVKDSRTAVEKSVTDASVTGATSDAPQEVFIFYVLVDADEANQTVTVGYNGAEEDVANVPIKADWCTTLQGNLTQVGLVSYTVKATIDSNWEDANAYYPVVESVNAETHTITTKMGGEIAQNPDWITTALGNGSELNIRGLMNDADIDALKNYLLENSTVALSLDLTGATLASIPQRAFYGVTGLVSIKLPEGLTSIGTGGYNGTAFSRCTGLQSVTFPSTLEVMEFSSFWGCTSLTTIDLSNTKVAKINAAVFNGCSSLTSVFFGPNTNEFCNTVFVGCSSLTTIDLSLCESVPTFTYSTDLASESPFYGLDMSNITIYVKDADMKTAFESSAWVSRVGFSASNFVVKSN